MALPEFEHLPPYWILNIEMEAQYLHSAHERVQREVQAARNHGASWREIGEALGVSRQAAQQRFGKVIERPSHMRNVFECNGLQFRLNTHERHWLLSYWDQNRWLSLSQWRSRKEAINAAECFTPIDR
jgi:hypothetical protein